MLKLKQLPQNQGLVLLKLWVLRRPVFYFCPLLQNASSTKASRRGLPDDSVFTYYERIFGAHGLSCQTDSRFHEYNI